MKLYISTPSSHKNAWPRLQNFFIPKTTTRYESEGIYQTHKSSQIINTQTSRVFSPSSYEFWENPVISYDFNIQVLKSLIDVPKTNSAP